jgi:hypothetical protein
MFESLKNALGLGKANSATQAKPASARGQNAANPAGRLAASPVSEWANTQGLAFSERRDGRGGYQIEGKVGGKLWRIEQGQPSRDFIKGTELRARAELGVRDDVAVMVMSRQLKNDLDKRAFALYTDTLQTVADPSLPEEMRWLSIYEEVGWESLGEAFLSHYAILADTRENAMAWVTQELVSGLTTWPVMDPGAPKILMLLRGKAYLRMQCTPGDLPTLEHAKLLFTTACELALSSLSTDIAA